MKKTTPIFLFILVTILHTTIPLFPSPLVSYERCPGRLGDHLLTYTYALLISHLSNWPLYGPTFKWSDQLTLSTLNYDKPPKNQHLIRLKHYTHDIHNNSSNTSSGAFSEPTITYICNLKTTILDLQSFSDIYRYVKNNPDFKTKLTTAISPITPLPSTPLPENMFTVAVHVRTGGGFDKPLLMNNVLKAPYKKHQYADQIYPQRFPPESYYIEQIALAARLCDKKPLFVHIFTDDRNPTAIVNRFKKQLPDLPITFSCRTTTNTHNTNVLEDLFDMTRFDCLIRPASSYSKMAQLLGNHKLIIYPKRVHWINDILIADRISIINNLS